MTNHGDLTDDLADTELELAATADDRPANRTTTLLLQRASLELRRHRSAQRAGADRVREVVASAFAEVSELSGAKFAHRHIEDIATRVAAKLSEAAPVAARKPSVAERRAAHGIAEVSPEERRENLERNLGCTVSHVWAPGAAWCLCGACHLTPADGH